MEIETILTGGGTTSQLKKGELASGGEKKGLVYVRLP